MLRLDSIILRRNPGFTLEVPRLDISVGERVTVIGPSGSGKTTLLRLIIGLEDADRGHIWLDGHELTGGAPVPPHARPISLLGQDSGLWPHLDALAHVAFARSAGLTLKGDPAARSLLELVRLADKAHRLPQTLSGGEQQRLALARALAKRPRILLLDEPMAHLDPVLAHDLLGLLEDLYTVQQLTRIQVTHGLQGLGNASERYLVMDHGHIVQDGPWQKLVDAPANDWVDRLIRIAA